MKTITIGNQEFFSYNEYEKAYLKKWYSIHPLTSVPDLIWVKEDWEYRCTRNAEASVKGVISYI